MFLHSPPRQLLWRSSHSFTSAGSHRRKEAVGGPSQGHDPVGEVSRGLSPAWGAWPRRDLIPLESSTACVREPAGS